MKNNAIPRALALRAAEVLAREPAPSSNGNHTVVALSAAFAPLPDEVSDIASPLVHTPQLDPAALYGIIGEYVISLAPHTEAHPAGVLASLLVAAGALIGREPFQRLDSSRHSASLFALIVGPSSDGRKGTAVSAARALIERTDSEFERANIANGLSSGQGLLYRLRDAPPPAAPSANAAKVRSPDTGVQDKRLLVCEEEFAQQLRLMNGRENTLSTVLRSAWDGKTLNSLTKGEPLTVTDPHVGLIAQITGEELEATAGAIEYSNGFLNRFLFFYVRRTKSLPFADPLPDAQMVPLARRMRDAVTFAKDAGEVTLSTAARALWATEYERLSVGAAGRVGQITKRGAPIVRRLAMIYALLDCSRTMEVEHLNAALAVWRYSLDSVRFLFRRSPGLSALATRLLEALSDAGADGLDKVALWKASGSNNRPVGEMNKALDELRTTGLADVTEIAQTSGRPRQVWRARAFCFADDGKIGIMGVMGNDEPVIVVNSPKTHNSYLPNEREVAPRLSSGPYRTRQI